VNANDLAKLYDRLTPRERLPLIIAASERGDEAEADRLAHAAPRMELRLPDYHGLGEGLLWLTFSHMIGQLDLSLAFWQGLALAFGREAFPDGPIDQARAERLWDLARMAGYKLGVEADAWRRLHEELHLDPEWFLRDVCGYDSVQLAEQAARLLPLTGDEAAACLRRLGAGDTKVPTIEGSLQAMRAVIDQRVAWWNVDKG
jgi:hypothetical protein